MGGRAKTIFPPIGELYEFTEEEIKQIRADNPAALRKPINETGAAPEPEVTSEEEVEEEKSAGRLTPQQQRQRDAQTQRDAQAARRAGARRTNEDDDL